MPSMAPSLRLVAKKSFICVWTPANPRFPSITQHRTFSVSPIRRPGQEEEEIEVEALRDGDAELNDRETNLRRYLASIPEMPRQKPGFQNMGKKEGREGMTLEDEEFKEDDISSLAHSQLDEHRERREYLRIAAWEMPLLTEMAKPFVLPTAEQPLRFRYTSYLGEKHPAERKVVLEFCPADIPDLTDVQRSKLIKLLGPRYNPESEIAKMSSDMFDNQAQNKRYLGDLVNKLLVEARDPSDTFEDVPYDTRHHVFKVKPKFPREWRMDEKRQAALNEAREKTRLLEEEKEEMGQLLDGSTVIEKAFEALLVSKESSAASELTAGGQRQQQKKLLGM